MALYCWFRPNTAGRWITATADQPSVSTISNQDKETLYISKKAHAIFFNNIFDLLIIFLEYIGCISIIHLLYIFFENI